MPMARYHELISSITVSRCHIMQVPRSSIQSMRQVSRRWRATVATEEYFSARRRLGLTEPWLYASISDWQVGGTEAL